MRNTTGLWLVLLATACSSGTSATATPAPTGTVGARPSASAAPGWTTGEACAYYRTAAGTSASAETTLRAAAAAAAVSDAAFRAEAAKAGAVARAGKVAVTRLQGPPHPWPGQLGKLVEKRLVVLRLAADRYQRLSETSSSRAFVAAAREPLGSSSALGNDALAAAQIKDDCA